MVILFLFRISRFFLTFFTGWELHSFILEQISQERKRNAKKKKYVKQIQKKWYKKEHGRNSNIKYKNVKKTKTKRDGGWRRRAHHPSTIPLSSPHYSLSSLLLPSPPVPSFFFAVTKEAGGGGGLRTSFDDFYNSRSLNRFKKFNVSCNRCRFHMSGNVRSNCINILKHLNLFTHENYHKNLKVSFFLHLSQKNILKKSQESQMKV